MKTRLANIPPVTLNNDRAVTTSVAIGDYFGVPHASVIKRIESLMWTCTPQFVAANFLVNKTAGSGNPETKTYQITRDGFFFLAMSFTEKKDNALKEAYIAAFNKAEAEHSPAPAITESLSSLSITAPPDQRFLIYSRCNLPVGMRPVLDDEILINMKSLRETCQDAGYALILYEDLRKLTAKEIMTLADDIEACYQDRKEKMSAETFSSPENGKS